MIKKVDLIGMTLSRWFYKGIWYRGVMASQQIANLPYRNVVRVRITAIPLATTQMTGTSAAR